MIGLYDVAQSTQQYTYKPNISSNYNIKITVPFQLVSNNKKRYKQIINSMTVKEN